MKSDTLTPFGALRAGNADGTIPAWTGEIVQAQAGYEPGQMPLIYTDEKPLYSITAANMAQYQDKLAPGVQALLQKYPDYRLDVYPTHRTGVAPQYVYDYIYKNAKNVKLSDDGLAVTSAYGGIPFPFSKNGNEVIWNHELSWQGSTILLTSDAHTVTAAGQIVLESRVGNSHF